MPYAWYHTHSVIQRDVMTSTAVSAAFELTAATRPPLGMRYFLPLQSLRCYAHRIRVAW
jgi:hypothetical protein